MEYIFIGGKFYKLRFIFFIFLLLFSFFKSQSQTTIFSENMGNPVGTTAIASNSFQNGSPIIFTGTGDVRATTTSSVYTGASGNGNVFLTTGGTKDFQIAGIDNSACSSSTLTFGVFKSTTASNGSELTVSVSTDGTTYTALTMPALPTGAGTAAWSLATITSGIPSAANLRIRFVNTSAATVQFRIDDVVLKGSCSSCVVPSISSQPTSVSTNTSGSATFTVSAGGTSLTYQWQQSSGGAFSNITNGGTNPTYSGVTTASLTISNPLLSMSGYSYQCVVTNTCGTATTNHASILNVTSAVSSSSCTLAGAIGTNYTFGCGASPTACDLASVYSSFGTFCGTSVVTCGASCSTSNVSYVYNLESTCASTIIAEFKARTIAGSDCSNSAMDGTDQVYITNTGGVVSSQTSTMSVYASTCTTYPSLGTYTTNVSTLNPGCGNSGGTVQMIITGGAVTIGGTMNRGDEIITYTLTTSGTCSVCPTFLPVGFVDFYATKNGNQNAIFWRVQNEENIKYYMIEKSNDGIHFFALGTKTVVPNDDAIKNYEMIDELPFEDVTYYRISTLEHSGAFNVFKIISVNTQSSEWDYNHYQKDGNLIIEFKNNVPKNSIVSLYDFSGNLLSDQMINDAQTKINTLNFVNGIYFVRITTPYKTKNFKIIIANN